MTWTSLKRTAASGGVVVTAAEAKAHLRMTHSSDDTLITDLIASATAWLEKACNRALAEQTWAMTLAEFPCDGVIRLPVASLVSLTVAYRDAAGDAQTLSASDYLTVSDEYGGELHLASDASWPATADRPDAVTVTCVVGYPKSGSDYAVNVPSALKTAIKCRVRIDYGDVADDQIEAVERTIETLIGPYKVLQR